MRAIIALAVLVGCAETETNEAEAETTTETENTEQTTGEAFEEAAEHVEEAFGDQNTIETPAKTTDVDNEESAVSSD